MDRTRLSFRSIRHLFSHILSCLLSYPLNPSPYTSLARSPYFLVVEATCAGIVWSAVALFATGRASEEIAGEELERSFLEAPGMHPTLTTITRRAYTLAMTTVRNQYQDAANRLSSNSSRLEFVYTTHPDWPQPPGNPTSSSNIQVSILDSSFNPPTLAHLSLASTTPNTCARLLLLSISNVDKTPKPSDAAPSQKLEMMVALAGELETKGYRNIAVGALNEPTFVGKSTLLLQHLSQRLGSNQDAHPGLELAFQMGWDTLIRVFASRYYPSKDAMSASFQQFFGQEKSSIICARRPSGSAPSASTNASTTIPADALTEDESELLYSPEVSQFYEQGKIKLVALNPEVNGISSSGVRGGTLEGAERWCPKKVLSYIGDHQLYFWS